MLFPEGIRSRDLAKSLLRLLLDRCRRAVWRGHAEGRAFVQRFWAAGREWRNDDENK